MLLSSFLLAALQEKATTPHLPLFSYCTYFPMQQMTLYTYLYSVSSVREDKERFVGKVEGLLNVPGSGVPLHYHGR